MKNNDHLQKTKEETNGKLKNGTKPKKKNKIKHTKLQPKDTILWKAVW